MKVTGNKVSDGNSEMDVPEPHTFLLSVVNAQGVLPLLAGLTRHPVMIADMSDRIAWVNEAFTHLTGWMLQDIAGLRIPESLYSLSTEQSTLQFITQRVSERRGFECEIEIVRRDGSPCWIAVDAQPVLDETAGPCGYVWFQSDISGLRKTEQRFHETDDRLPETGRVAEIGAWQLDVATMKLRWSAQTCRMHDVDEDFVPELATAVEFYAPEARSVISAAVQKGIENGEPWDLELPLITAKGRKRWARAIGHPIVEEGTVVRIFGTFQNITDRHLAAADREQLHAQLLQSQKMESVGRLAGGIAHDFNNMLAVIMGHAEMMTLDESMSPSQKSHLKAIQMASQRSADLTHQLLAFARRQTAAPQQINVNNTIKRILDLLRKSLGEDISLEWFPGDGLWLVSIDPVQLDQMLANFCMNSRDAISGGGRILLSTRNERLTALRRLRFSEVPAGDYVVLTISDNGCGISDAAIAHLFEPFNTTKPPGAGSGLGLATVYGIVQQNAGAIDVDSDRHTGTTFRIYLPRVAARDGQSIQSAESTISRDNVESVLLVEDEPSLVRIGKLCLKQLGYKTFTATNAAEALQFIRSRSTAIDVVISDVVMPGLNGWELARQIHALRPKTRFVFMSGYGAEATSRGRASQHSFPVLCKPFDLQRLASAIRSAISLEPDLQTEC